MNRYFSQMRSVLMVLLATLPIVLSAENGDAGTLVCANSINVSANSECAIDLTADQLLISDSSPTPGPYELRIVRPNGLVLDMTDVSAFINQTVQYTITNLTTQNTCWGYITIENKSVPTMICDECTDPMVSDPNCILNCSEYPLFAFTDLNTGQSGYDPDLLDKIIPTEPRDFIADFISSNCNQPVSVTYRDIVGPPDCNDDVILNRIWTLEYPLANGRTERIRCNRYYKFVNIDIVDVNGDPIIVEGDGTGVEDMIFMPPQYIEVPICSGGYSPEVIAAFYDDPTTEDEDSNDNGIDPDEGDIDHVIENNEGIWRAYPHYYSYGLRSNSLHPQPIDDNICTVTARFTDLIFDSCSSDCNGNVKVARTWTMLDWCNNTFFDYIQTIDVKDGVPPIIEAEHIVTSVDPHSCSGTVYVPEPTRMVDDCDENVTYRVELSSAIADITGNAKDGYIIHNLKRGIYELFYVAEDCCGNIARYPVQLQIDDLTPPVPIVIQNIVVDLAPSGIIGVPDRGVAKLYAADIDNGSFDGCTGIDISVRRPLACSDQDTVWGDFVEFCCSDLAGVDRRQITVDFRARDWNGNENFISTTVLLEDKGISTSCPIDRVLSCDDDIWNFDLTGSPTSQTSCDNIPILIDTVETFDRTIPRNKRATEGNVPGYIGVAVDAYDPACGFGAIRREWRTVGGQAFCTQWFVIEPGDSVFDPETIVFPDDQIVSCQDFDSGEPTWVDGSCNLIGLSLQSDTIRNEANSCFTILNNWAVINWCTYDPSDTDLNNQVEPADDGVVLGRYDHYQTIQITDETFPEVSSEPDRVIPVDQDCEAKGVTLSAVGTDTGDCASPWLGWTVRVDLNADWQIDYIYTNNTTPIVNGEPNPFYLSKTTSGQELSITLPTPMASSKAQHRVVWSVNDGCGNETVFTSYFTVEDTKAPTPYCLNLGTTVMQNGEVELWAIDFNIGSFDNCTPDEELFYTFTEVPPPPRCDEEYDSQSDLEWYDGSFWFYDADGPTVDDDDDCPLNGEGAYDDGGYNRDTGSFEGFSGNINRWSPGLRSSGRIFTSSEVGASQILTVPVYVWDGHRNIDFCFVSLRVVDNDGGAGRVAGIIQTEDKAEIENVRATLSTDLPEYPKYVHTNSSGTFAFDENVLTMDYKLSAEKNDDYLNGVSTIDLIKIQRHILGLERLDSPYKMIAADINNDKQLNGVDLVELRKLILGIYTELPMNDSWKIFDQNSSVAISNPWNYDMAIEIENIQDDMMEQDFIGVKIGDVNNSVIANSRPANKPVLSNGTFTFEDRIVQAGETIEIPFSYSEEMSGFQLGMNFTGMEIIAVTGAQLHASDFIIQPNRVDLSFSPEETMSGKLFSITAVAQETGQLSSMIELSSEQLEAEVYTTKLEIRKLNLSAKSSSMITVAQNVPNPFKTETYLNFELTQAAELSITFYDVTGKLLRSMKHEGIEGRNKVKVTTDNLVTGLIYYKIAGDNFYALDNMIITD